MPANTPPKEAIRFEEHIEERIHHESPEGRPAQPWAGPRQIMLLLILPVIALLIAAAIFAIVGWIAVALGVAIFAIIVLVANPIALASILRARERQHIIRDEERKGHLPDQGGERRVNKRDIDQHAPQTAVHASRTNDRPR